jgi:16S rRNA (adenine1518-N6/adenine1519-N6)-dimethyltransferase
MKRLGQHFLADSSALRAIASSLALQPHEIVIEIGAGHGELTKELLSYNASVLNGSAKVIAIEKDPTLAAGLKQSLSNLKNIKVVEGDVREILPRTVSTLRTDNYKIVGNIPYYLTGFLLRIISLLEPRPSRVVLTIQKEVAERVCEMPPRMNRLAAMVQFWANPKIVRRISRSSFVPPPKVDSAILCLAPKNMEWRISAGEYVSAVKAIFAQPGKTVLNNITAVITSKSAAVEVLSKTHIPLKSRPHDLSLEKIVLLAPTVGKYCSARSHAARDTTIG